MRRSIVWLICLTFAAILLGFSCASSEAAGKYELAWWREQGEQENGSCMGRQILHVHVFDENGNPKPNVRIETTWGVLLAVTGERGEAKVILDVSNSRYDFICVDNIGSTSDVGHPVTTRRWPCWGHYSYDVGFLFKSDPTAPGTFDTDVCGTINLADSHDTDAPRTKSIAYSSVDCLDRQTDNFSLGTFQGTGSWFGQTFKATGDRIVAVQAHATRGGTDQLSYNLQILQGGPNGPPVSPVKNVGPVWPNQQTQQTTFFGVNEVPVVPGETYFLKIWHPSAGMNAYRVERSNYPDGMYYEGNTAFAGLDLKGLVVCMTYGIENSGSLRVDITPQGAVNAGAQWRRVGTGTWRDSGSTEENIPAGSYNVEFRDNVSGWEKPANQNVTIVADETATLTATYTQTIYVVSYISTFNGSWSPGPIGPHPSGWSYDGYGAPAYSEQEQGMVLPPHDGTNSAYRFNVPGSSSISGSMVLAKASVSLDSFALPGQPIDWNYPIYLKSDVYAADYGVNTRWETSIAMFNYHRTPDVVEWGNDGHPNSQWRTLVTEIDPGQAGKTGTLVLFTNFNFVGKTFAQTNLAIWENVRMEYVPVSTGGSLSVTISPQEAANAGAQWRRTGTSTWRNSGTTETGIPVGSHIVEFKPVSGWTVPDNQTVTIYSGQTTTTAGTYVQDCEIKTIAEALAMPDDSCVRIVDRIVTAGTSSIGGGFYIQEADRSAGIRIASAVSVNQGDEVDVTGVLETVNGERQLTASSVTQTAAGQLVAAPIFVSQRNLGGSAFGDHTLGVWQGQGLYNVGLLVTISGRVTARGDGYIYIDDGSGCVDGSGDIGVRVDTTGLTNPTESYVLVTGISTVRTVGANGVRAIRPRTQTDIIGF